MHQSILTDPVQVISHHDFAEIRLNNKSGQRSLHATKNFRQGEMLCRFTAGIISETPNYLTVQTGEHKHITLVPEFLQYINHSCDPNVFFDTTKMEVIALRDISVNEEFSFFYPSTEWSMAQPFYCYCGSEHCLQNIQGAMHLSPDQVKKYSLTNFIQKKLKQY